MSEYDHCYEAAGRRRSRPEALLFTGDCVRSLTHEQLEVLGDLALSFGAKMQVVRTIADVDRQVAELREQLIPVPVTLNNLREFGTSQGLKNPRWHAKAIWRLLILLPSAPQHVRSAPDDGMPPVRFIGALPGELPDDELVVDLRSIYERFMHPGMDDQALNHYHIIGPEHDTLVALLNQWMSPEQPVVNRWRSIHWDDRRWDGPPLPGES